MEITSSLVVMAPVDPDCKAPASGAGVNSGLSHSRRCPPLNFPRYIDDMRRLQTRVYPLVQQAGLR